MGQITEAFVAQMLADCTAGRHPPLTIWEARQLALAWADRERMRSTQQHIVALLDPIVGGDDAPIQALVRRIIARASSPTGVER